MQSLADAVLPLIRSRSDLHRWSAANAHGARMHEAVDLLEAAMDTADPATVWTVTTKAIASATTVIMRADDSSGLMGDAIRRLLLLHPRAAERARPPAARLVDWMIRFQFDDECDFFTIDPVAYAGALGESGMARYRARLDEIAAGLGPHPHLRQIYASPHARAWYSLQHNAQRLAVLDRDADAVIRTHARDQQVAAWLEDTAQALEEIGEVDLAIEWARRAVDLEGGGYQSLRAAETWCRLLGEHRPDDVLAARTHVFERWPSSSSAARLHRAAGAQWPRHRDEVMARLAASPRDAVEFVLGTLHDVRLAWEIAMASGLQDADTWTRLVKEYEKVDKLAVLPVLGDLVRADLEVAGAGHYRTAARRLVRMRRIAAGSDREEEEVDAFVAELREANRRRPRLQSEFDRAGLP
ncbi:hypothetical protein [Fodinibacter luteus]|uniref:hypothetical protein n=1 Tax=Fodinibacter luteus TaxID=552064 RepID=UPI0031E7DB2E